MKIDRRTFVAGLGGSIASLSVPGVTSCAKNDRDPRQHRGGGLGTVDDNTIFDVCIIGSGFAGSVLGEALVRRGIRTVILESGPDLSGQRSIPFSTNLTTIIAAVRLTILWRPLACEQWEVRRGFGEECARGCNRLILT